MAFEALIVLMVAALLVSQHLHRRDLLETHETHRRDMRETMNGISDHLKKVHDDVWNQNQFEIRQLRGELEIAQAKVLRLRVPRPSKAAATPAASAPHAPTNGREPPPRRRELDLATGDGGI